MAKKKNDRAAYRKILDAWSPSEDAGEPIGFFSTTYSFDSDFFEDQCVDRFLSINSSPEEEDKIIYLVEREERLAPLSCRTVLVDDSQSAGTRSLRWDVLPVRIRGGVFHAKVTILYWANLIRVVYASANLTRSGYRKNQEIFTVVDFYPDGNKPGGVLHDTLTFANRVIRTYLTDVEKANPCVTRSISFFDKIRKKAIDWNFKEKVYDFMGQTIKPVFVVRGSQDALSQILKIWPKQKLPSDALVTSPFFDDKGSPDEPCAAMWDRVLKKGWAVLTFNVEVVKSDEQTSILAPKEISEIPYSRTAAETRFSEIDATSGIDGGDRRPLHAKSIVLSDDQHLLYLTGSSNFTSRGLGLSSNRNVEANLVYLTKLPDGTKGRREIEKSFILAYSIDQDVDELTFDYSPSDREPGEETNPRQATDDLFCYGLYSKSDSSLKVIIFTTGINKLEWKLQDPTTNEILYDAKKWDLDGRPSVFELPWNGKPRISEIKIKWDNRDNFGSIPLIIEKFDTLPPPEEVSSLPLDVILSVLSSKMPFHLAIRDYLRKLKKKSNNQKADNPKSPKNLDPLQRLDSTSFILQRTRRISWAMESLGNRLIRPAATVEGFLWRLTGPVGVIAFADAIETDTSNTTEHAIDEKVFLLSELVLLLRRLQFQQTDWSISVAEARKLVDEVVSTISLRLENLYKNALPDIARYSQKCVGFQTQRGSDR